MFGNKKCFFAAEQVWNNNKLEYLATKNAFLLVSKSRTITGMFGNKKCFFAEQVLNNNKRDLN